MPPPVRTGATHDGRGREVRLDAGRVGEDLDPGAGEGEDLGAEGAADDPQPRLADRGPAPPA